MKQFTGTTQLKCKPSIHRIRQYPEWINPTKLYIIKRDEYYHDTCIGFFLNDITGQQI